MKICLHRLDERGAAMVEFAMMLPLFVIIMLLLMVTYNIVVRGVSSREKAYYEMRLKVAERDGGEFGMVLGQGTEHAEIYGRMGEIIGRRQVRLDTKVVSYGGTYTGLGSSKYRHRYLVRQVNP